MKKLMIMLAALAALWTTGCGEAAQDDSWDIDKCTDDCEEKTEKPELDGTYISGHLGNYDGCPEDGFTAGGNDGDPEPSGDFAAGACEEGQDCPSLMACEDGQITVRLRNTGDAEARALQITTIELFDAVGTSRATLPLIDAIDTDTNETFSGTLAAGDEVTLRVEFQGPANPYSLLQTAEDDAAGDMDRSSTYATIQLTVTGENHDDVVIESTELYPVPSVDT
jgi:hypothetical protein